MTSLKDEILQEVQQEKQEEENQQKLKESQKHNEIIDVMDKMIDFINTSEFKNILKKKLKDSVRKEHNKYYIYLLEYKITGYDDDTYVCVELTDNDYTFHCNGFVSKSVRNDYAKSIIDSTLISALRKKLDEFELTLKVKDINVKDDESIYFYEFIIEC